MAPAHTPMFLSQKLPLINIITLIIYFWHNMICNLILSVGTSTSTSPVPVAWIGAGPLALTVFSTFISRKIEKGPFVLADRKLLDQILSGLVLSFTGYLCREMAAEPSCKAGLYYTLIAVGQRLSTSACIHILTRHTSASLLDPTTLIIRLQGD